MENKKYYYDMLQRGRGHLFQKDGHIAAVITFFIGDDDAKYLYNHEPWTVVDDDPDGTTVYIDQLIVSGHQGNGCMHRELAVFLRWVKKEFKNVKRAKWVRVNAEFRKHGIQEGVKANVHTKSIR